MAVEAGLVLTSIGYRGEPVPDLPFDERAAVVPNDSGRVVGAPGAYVAGWIKRGPNGFIGTNKSCAMQTVATLVEDFNAGLLTDPTGRQSALTGCSPTARWSTAAGAPSTLPSGRGVRCRGGHG